MMLSVCEDIIHQDSAVLLKVYLKKTKKEGKKNRKKKREKKGFPLTQTVSAAQFFFSDNSKSFSQTLARACVGVYMYAGMPVSLNLNYSPC